VPVHKTPREAKAVYHGDWMRKLYKSHPVKVSEEANRKSNPSYTICT